MVSLAKCKTSGEIHIISFLQFVGNWLNKHWFSLSVFEGGPQSTHGAESIQKSSRGGTRFSLFDVMIFLECRCNKIILYLC